VEIKQRLFHLSTATEPLPSSTHEEKQFDGARLIQPLSELEPAGVTDPAVAEAPAGSRFSIDAPESRHHRSELRHRDKERPCVHFQLIHRPAGTVLIERICCLSIAHGDTLQSPRFPNFFRNEPAQEALSVEGGFEKTNAVQSWFGRLNLSPAPDERRYAPWAQLRKEIQAPPLNV